MNTRNGRYWPLNELCGLSSAIPNAKFYGLPFSCSRKWGKMRISIFIILSSQSCHSRKENYNVSPDVGINLDKVSAFSNISAKMSQQNHCTRFLLSAVHEFSFTYSFQKSCRRETKTQADVMPRAKRFPSNVFRQTSNKTEPKSKKY